MGMLSAVVSWPSFEQQDWKVALGGGRDTYELGGGAEADGRVGRRTSSVENFTHTPIPLLSRDVAVPALHGAATEHC
jgi:hypothetical protein